MNGCHNRAPFVESYQAQDGWELAWLRALVEVPFRNSPECNYTKSNLGAVDKGCIGCKWRQEHA